MSYAITGIYRGKRILIGEFPTRSSAYKKITELKARNIVERARVARFNSRNKNRYKDYTFNQEVI